MFGEGVVFVMLESELYVTKWGVNILCEFFGYGIVVDGCYIAISHVCG